MEALSSTMEAAFEALSMTKLGKLCDAQGTMK